MLNYYSSNKFRLLAILLIVGNSKIAGAQEISAVAPFNKVIISPHIQSIFTQGDKESVTIRYSSVGKDKIHIENNGKTLRIYLEGAKEITKNQKRDGESPAGKQALYSGTVLKVTVNYKTLEELSIRGEETAEVSSKLDQDNFNLTVYGESKVHFSDLQLKTMQTKIYGESSVDVKSGTITEQKITAYGESKINLLALSNQITMATLYGESELKLNTSDLISITSFGESKIGYKGNPEIRKGLNIGKAQIYRLD